MTETSPPALRKIAEPAIEPITKEMVKTLAAFDADLTTHDDLLDDIIIPAVRADAEHLTGRKFIEQTWEVVMDAFPSGEIKLPIRPVLSIVSVAYIDGNGDEQTIGSSNYTLENADEARPWLFPADGYEWPATLDTANAVVIRLKAGYGDSVANVPPAARYWMTVSAASKIPQSGVEMNKYVERGLDLLVVYGD